LEFRLFFDSRERFKGRGKVVLVAMEITIKTMVGDAYQLQVDPNWTLAQVKEKIREKEGFPVEKQRLLHVGKELEPDSMRLSELGVTEQATLHLALRLAAVVEPLPSGWEQRTTPDGKIYYVDHATRTTSWNDPRKMQPSPTVSQAPVSISTANSSPLLSQTSQSSMRQSVNLRPGQMLPTGATLISPVSGAVQPLPAGWEMRRTLEGKVYYVDHNTKTTHWNLPRGY